MLETLKKRSLEEPALQWVSLISEVREVCSGVCYEWRGVCFELTGVCYELREVCYEWREV